MSWGPISLSVFAGGRSMETSDPILIIRSVVGRRWSKKANRNDLRLYYRDAVCQRNIHYITYTYQKIKN
jgi:hypothetical protein